MIWPPQVCGLYPSHITCKIEPDLIRGGWYDCRNWLGAALFNPYSILLCLGILAGLFWAAFSDPSQNHSQNRSASLRPAVARFDLGLIAVVGGLIGARVGYVVSHWEYYNSRPEEWLWFWQGGLPWIGALVGSLILLGILNRLLYHNFGLILDVLALPALIVGIFAWIGCWLSGCAYGYSLDIQGVIPPSPDYFGVLSPRWPTQIIGALLLFGTFLALISPRLPIRSIGLHGSLAMLSIALSSLILSFTRADPIRVVRGFRLDTIASASSVILAIVCIMYFTIRKKNRD